AVPDIDAALRSGAVGVAMAGCRTGRPSSAPCLPPDGGGCGLRPERDCCRCRGAEARRAGWGARMRHREMAVCLGPLAWLFTVALAMMGRGVMPLNFGIPLILAALLGPLGLWLALRTILFEDSPVGRIATIVLTLLGAWTVLEYTGQIVEGAFLSSWRDYVLMALLPPLAVAHLLQINSRRRATAAIA